jgi:hypothetical protein
MENYKQVLNMFGSVSSTCIQRMSDNSFIPNDNDNKDWLKYQDWLSLGNTPEAA